MSNDLISRAALLEGFDVHKVTEYDESGCGVDYRAVPVDAIMKAPAVDAEPVRHGRWIRRVHNEEVNYRWYASAECSECGEKIKEIAAWHFLGAADYVAEAIAIRYAADVKLSNFCPNCGAKMDGGDNNGETSA